MYESCNALGVSRSSYFYWVNKGKKNEEKLISLCQQIIIIYFDSKGIYGCIKISKMLDKQGIKCSVSKVSRIMKRLGIRSIVAEKFSSKASNLKDEEKKSIVNLIKSLDVNKINQVWTTDITYIKTKKEGNCYLISFIDYYSKRVIAWNLTRNQKTKDVLDVLKKAVKKRNPTPGLIIHSDKGPQMRSKEYREYLSKNNFIASYTSLNHSCDENAAQESFHALLKKECIYQNMPNNFNEAYSAIHNYIENFYNTVRIHSSIGYKSPIDFEADLLSVL